MSRLPAFSGSSRKAAPPVPSPAKNVRPPPVIVEKSPAEEEEDEDMDTTAETSAAAGGIDHIKVCVRIRPLIRDDRDAQEVLAWRWDQQTITQERFVGKGNSSPTNKPPENSAVPSYTFDHIFIPEDTNDMIYDAVIRQLVNNCMEGYHGSVFSYGQTSSGKTFTMNGTSKQPGVIPLAVYDCFQLIDDYNDREFLFRASYLEVYNEQVLHVLLHDSLLLPPLSLSHLRMTG